MDVHFCLYVDPVCTVRVKYMRPGSLLTLRFHFLATLDAEKLNQHLFRVFLLHLHAIEVGRERQPCPAQRMRCL